MAAHRAVFAKRRFMGNKCLLAIKEIVIAKNTTTPFGASGTESN